MSRRTVEVDKLQAISERRAGYRTPKSQKAGSRTRRIEVKAG